jgi:acetyl esterase/lipase
MTSSKNAFSPFPTAGTFSNLNKPVNPVRLIMTWLLMCVALSFQSVAGDMTQPERLSLWSDRAPVGDGIFAAEDAYITLYRAANANGAAVVICPGGGYGGLVTGPEGTGIARWLNEHGIAGIVLEYRLPRGRSFVPLLDAQRALRTVRFKAALWGIDPKRIGIMGFSAGGHLASTAATHFDSGDPNAVDPIQQISCRPDFTVLIYPVITMGDKTHKGSRTNLLGHAPTAEARALFSNELQVTDQTPPTFLAHALDDRVVSPDNSRMFYQALQAHRVSGHYLELPSGDHGLNGYKGPMWDAWQAEALTWLAAQQIIPAPDGLNANHAQSVRAWPDHDTLANGVQQVRLLPGHEAFVFTLYGVPGDLDTVRQLVRVMREQKLGNGFDPGPGPHPSTRPIFDYLATVGWPVVCYPGGDMQVQGGRGVLGRDNELSLTAMDQAGLFTAVQLGEWGYYFHNLACTESWWRGNFGRDFDTYKHLMKPAGLAGYDQRPTSKQACYDILKAYFRSKSRDLLGRVISVTGHSHYEAYAAEWGTRCIGLEVGENIAFTQSKLAFARGASRQWQRPWSVQVSPWFAGACTTSGPLRMQGQDARGMDAGHSLSFYERMWLHAWFAGAAMVTPENSIAIFFEKAQAPWTLTSHGRKAAEVFAFVQSHDRGVPYTPVAIVLDHLAGYNGYMDKPWGILQPTAGDREVRDLFDAQLFPGSDHIHTNPFPDNPELSYLRPTPYGEIFDVLLTSVPPDILPAYPVILLAGDIEFDDAFLSELEKSLRRGSRVLMSPRHRETMGTEFERVASQGDVEVLEPWTHPVTGRPTAISNDRLAKLVQDTLPIEVTGDAIQYQINRTARGWIVELINNAGVIKTRNQPAVIDAAAVAQVQLKPKFSCKTATQWRTRQSHDNPVILDIGPGEVEFVEFQ